MFEEFDLLKALFRFFFGFVRSAEVFAFFGYDFVATGNFFDHGLPPEDRKDKDCAGEEKSPYRMQGKGARTKH